MKDKKEVHKKIQEISDKIVKEFKPEKIILFGSYAWGQPDEDSDVDLFVIKEANNTRQVAREISVSIPRPFPIDLIVYTSEQAEKRKKMNDPFINKIFNEGKVFYG